MNQNPCEPAYYVFRVGHTAPTKRHQTFGEAEKEAHRLAQKHPNHTFEILRVEAFVYAPLPEPQTFYADPF